MWCESGYYPAGAEFDPNAPWNEEDAEYKECPDCEGEGGIWYDEENDKQYTKLEVLEMDKARRDLLEFIVCEKCEGSGKIEVEPYEPDWDDLDD